MNVNFDSSFPDKIVIRVSAEIEIDKEELQKVIGQLLAKGLQAPDQRQKLPEQKGPIRLSHTVKETAALLGTSQKTVYRLIDRGLLRASKALRHKLIPRKEIDRFLAESM